MLVFALFLLLIVVPIVELAVLIQVAGVIGVLPTVGLVVASSLIGFWLMKAEGLGVLRRMQAQVAEGQMPATEVVDGVLVLLGGLLMVLPGFISSIVGLLLLLPPVRALLRPVVLARARRRIDRGQARFVAFTTSSAGAGFPPGPTFGGPVYDADAHLAPRDDPAGRPPSSPPELRP